MFNVKASPRIVLLLILFIALAVAMSAATTANGSKAEHCVVQIEPVQPGEKYSEMSKPVCFETFAEAAYFASGGVVRLAADFEAAEATEHILNPPGIRRSTVIGVDYDLSGFGGNTISWTTSNPNGCSGGSTYAASSMPSGWANKVSSARSYQGCGTYNHYDLTNYGGSVHDCGYSCSSMGAMDNQTESERWSQ
ncbi:MAG: hypothetical protein DWQ07_01425 [Chloroflexi bacterium]|nr:MAG: hypothetical protein DWQ07_01425 [Chloroflexota bacterium]MBL1193843.1 hypothetical protein [Chloroflexota bacterium]NOH11137.1 hypothetical protein [Chloroflexota bacterium]